MVDFTNSKWLTYFCILLCICYCFSHLIRLFPVTWLSLLYKFSRVLIYFLFLSDEGPTIETVHFTIRIGSIITFLYFDLKLHLTISFWWQIKSDIYNFYIKIFSLIWNKLSLTIYLQLRFDLKMFPAITTLWKEKSTQKTKLTLFQK